MQFNTKNTLVAAGFAAAMTAAAMVPQARAEVVLNDRLTIAPFSFNCNGDMVFLSGDFHRLTRVTNNKNTFHFGVHTDMKLSGTGSPSGADYGLSRTLNYDVNGGPGYNETQTLHFNLIGKGKVPNRTIHFTFHDTVNANGTLTSSVDNFRVDCH